MLPKVSLILNIILLIGALVLSGFLFMACNSFEIIQIKGQPDACNDMYTIMKLTASQSGKDNAWAALSWPDCKAARDKKAKIDKELRCREAWFGKDKPIDRTQFQKWSDYMECLNKE